MQNILITNLITYYDEKILNQDRKILYDYFSWGRDARHLVDNTEVLPSIPNMKKSIKKKLKYALLSIKSLVSSRQKFIRDIEKFASFSKSYESMSDDYSKNLFLELIIVMVLGEKRFSLSCFESIHQNYESVSDTMINSAEFMNMYKWKLKRVSIGICDVYTCPEMLNLWKLDRVYRYDNEQTIIDIETGDIVIDCGIGWGDTTTYFSHKVGEKGEIHAFDINAAGIDALQNQIGLNTDLDNIYSNLKAVSDVDYESLHIDEAGPSSRIAEKSKGVSTVKSICLDTYFKDEMAVNRVDFIKMDIEGAEVPALVGAKGIIKEFKPKMAISVYHKWDDLKVISELLLSIRPDYSLYVDCVTGFGGEAILYAH